MRAPRYHAYTLRNYQQVPQLAALPEEEKFAIEVVGRVLPFRSNNYVVEELIDWERVPDDPVYRITFPQRGMLRPEHFDRIADLLKRGASEAEIEAAAHEIRLQLNPHPAGQMEYNVPELDGKKLPGMQHKYRETVLFFPSQGQTCHAYCTFCFRWPQFIGDESLKFASQEAAVLVEYIQRHPEVQDVLFTGGDPMVMRIQHLRTYIEPLLKIPHLHTIRIGTRVLTYWPYRFLTDRDADDVLRLFEAIVRAGKHLAIMAHFNHPQELRTEAVRQAIQRLRDVGAEIRTQSPLLRHINDDPDVWAQMWRKQVDLGMIPYYMFIARDTGAQHYFAVPLVRAWEIFRDAYKQVSGVCRTVRGPSMSAKPGKVYVAGVAEVKGERVLVLSFIQGRNPDWVGRPFFAAYDPEAIWLDQLRPAFGKEKFFFEEELEGIFLPKEHVLSKEEVAAVAVHA